MPSTVQPTAPALNAATDAAVAPSADLLAAARAESGAVSEELASDDAGRGGRGGRRGGGKGRTRPADGEAPRF